MTDLDAFIREHSGEFLRLLRGELSEMLPNEPRLRAIVNAMRDTDDPRDLAAALLDDPVYGPEVRVFLVAAAERAVQKLPEKARRYPKVEACLAAQPSATKQRLCALPKNHAGPHDWER